MFTESTNFYHCHNNLLNNLTCWKHTKLYFIFDEHKTQSVCVLCYTIKAAVRAFESQMSHYCDWDYSNTICLPLTFYNFKFSELITFFWNWCINHSISIKVGLHWLVQDVCPHWIHNDKIVLSFHVLHLNSANNNHLLGKRGVFGLCNIWLKHPSLWKEKILPTQVGIRQTMLQQRQNPLC